MSRPTIKMVRFSNFLKQVFERVLRLATPKTISGNFSQTPLGTLDFELA